MPRMVLTLNNFSGGMCDDPNPRDLKDNELYQAIDIEISREGLIRMMGGSTSITTFTIDQAICYQRGHGLFTFSADFSSTGGYQVTDYLVVAGTSSTSSYDGICQIFESDGTVYTDTASSSQISLATQSTGAISNTKTFYPSAYYIDGALRICDANLDSTYNQNIWVGFIQRGGSINSVTAGWYHEDNDISAPIATWNFWGHGLYGQATGASASTLVAPAASTKPFENYTFASTTALTGNAIAVATTGAEARYVLAKDSNTQLKTQAATGISDWTGKNFRIFPAAGYVTIDIRATASIGSWTAGTYTFGLTYMYDGKQESKIYELSGSTSISASDRVTISFQFTPGYGNRVSGIRLYTRENDDDTHTWYLVGEVDFEDGVGRANLQDQTWTSISAYYTVTVGVTGTYYYGSITCDAPSADTYYGLTGYNFDEPTFNSIQIDGWKSAVLINRRIYAGGVRVGTDIYGDSIFRSFPERFDIFTKDNRLDIISNDGEDIVKLEQFADRILEFKKRKLFIINAAQEIEYVEGEYDWLGIDQPFHSVRTEHGVVWLNTRGAYLYNGRQIIDLFLDPENPRRRKINLANWNSFIDSNPIIGYDANNKRVIIIANSTIASGSKSDVMIYNLIEANWVKGTDKYGTTGKLNVLTNMITNWDGEVLVADSSNSGGSHAIYKWSTSPKASTSFSIWTKDFSMGLPGVKKNFYYSIITSKEGQDQVNVRWYKNGDIDSTTGSLGDLDSGSSPVAERTSPTAGTGSNWYSMSMRIFGSALTSFELNDMSIIYRPKGLH